MRAGATSALALALSLLAATGCVGLIALGADEREFQDPRVGRDPQASLLGTIAEDPSLPPVDVEALRRLWGEPDEVEDSGDGGQLWIYTSKDLRWRGVVLFLVVLPLPLAIPVGRETATFTVRDGQVVAAEIVRKTERVELAGVIPAVCTRVGVECSGWGRDEAELGRFPLKMRPVTAR
jgi:uncharacterized protein (DUF58 family)